MKKFKVGDKVRNNFPLTNGGGDPTEVEYETTYGQIGEIIEVNYFYLVKFKNFNKPLRFAENELVPEVRETIPASDLGIGQIGRIVSNLGYSDQHVGKVIIRAYKSFVSLDNPTDTWDLDAPFYVEKFNKGEKFEIVAK